MSSERKLFFVVFYLVWGWDRERWERGWILFLFTFFEEGKAMRRGRWEALDGWIPEDHYVCVKEFIELFV